MFKHKKINLSLTLALLSVANIAEPSVIQRFYGNNYLNPASINGIKNFQMVVGSHLAYIFNHFEGNVFGNYGTATSYTDLNLPFLLLAQRVDPKFVIGVNVTQPFFSNFAFPSDSVVAPVTTNTLIRDVDINTMLSYKATDNLSLGAGFNINDVYRLELSREAPFFGNVVNTFTHTWSYGWNIGIFFAANKCTFLEAAYFSRLTPEFDGTSVLGTQVNNDAEINGLVLPATTMLAMTNKFTPKWTSILRVFYSQWSDTDVVRLKNFLPVDGALPVHYDNTFAVGTIQRYQLNDKWGVLGIAIYDQGATKENITVNFPADDTYILRAGVNYKIDKAATIQLIYGYTWINTEVDRPFDLNIVGSEHLRIHSIEGTFTYNI